jgi:TP901 family phage tail tape measure protein
MDNQLRIKLAAEIDEKRSQLKIKQQTDKIAKELEKNGIKLSIDVDSKTAAKVYLDVTKQQKELNRLHSEALKINQNIDNQNKKRIDTEEKINKKVEERLSQYKKEKELQAQNIKSTYGKEIKSPQAQAQIAEIMSGLNGLNAKDLSPEKLRAVEKQTNTQFESLKANMKTARVDSQGFTNDLIHNAKKMLEWTIIGTAIFGSMRALKDGISYVIEMDNALNEIRIVTGESQQEVQGLTKNFNDLAKAMSVSTVEIAKTSVELYRQGLSQKEVEERMKSTIQYAKISSISLADSNKIITATANATGESVTKITDIFAILGDSTASGADEIGEALQRVASAAENSGISIEKSASWISVVSSKTRESASTIGRSLNSIISRYESIKSTGFNEEDATKINDVTQALSDVGIVATDSLGQLKPIANVIDELGGKWEALTKNEKAYIATTLFG